MTWQWPEVSGSRMHVELSVDFQSLGILSAVLTTQGIGVLRWPMHRRKEETINHRRSTAKNKEDIQCIERCCEKEEIDCVQCLL